MGLYSSSRFIYFKIVINVLLIIFKDLKGFFFLDTFNNFRSFMAKDGVLFIWLLFSILFL